MSYASFVRSQKTLTASRIATDHVKGIADTDEFITELAINLWKPFLFPVLFPANSRKSVLHLRQFRSPHGSAERGHPDLFGFPCFLPISSESLNGGLANGGLRYVSTIVHDCLRLSSFCDESSLERGPKRPQKCAIVDDSAQIAESGLKPPFESPHLDFP